jgi:hypothetical protein
MNSFQTIFKKPISQKGSYVSITKVSGLILFREIIALFSEKHKDSIHNVWKNFRVAEYKHM